jgi:hypothetical protein
MNVFIFTIKVCDYDLIGGGDPIGKIKLGWNQSKEYKPGFKHWKEVLENPRRPIIKWHVLQVLIPQGCHDDSAIQMFNILVLSRNK